MARDFDGTNDHAIVTHNAVLNVDDNTIVVWLNLDSTGIRIIQTKGLTTSGTIKLWIFSDNKYYYDLPEATVRLSSLTVTTGSWRHIAAGHDAGAGAKNQIIWLDGLESFTGTDTSAAGTNTSDLWIGEESNGTRDLPGKLAYIILYNVQLSTAEILALKNGVNPFAIRNENIIMFLPFTGNDSPEGDLSGNNLTAALTGTTKFAGNPPVEHLSNYISGFC